MLNFKRNVFPGHQKSSCFPSEPASEITSRWWQRVSLLSAACRGLYFHMNPRFVLSIFDIRSHLWAMSLRKFYFLFSYAIRVARLFFLDHFIHGHHQILEPFKARG